MNFGKNYPDGDGGRFVASSVRECLGPLPIDDASLKAASGTPIEQGRVPFDAVAG